MKRAFPVFIILFQLVVATPVILCQFLESVGPIDLWNWEETGCKINALESQGQDEYKLKVSWSLPEVGVSKTVETSRRLDAEREFVYSTFKEGAIVSCLVNKAGSDEFFLSYPIRPVLYILRLGVIIEAILLGFAVFIFIRWRRQKDLISGPTVIGLISTVFLVNLAAILSMRLFDPYTSSAWQEMNCSLDYVNQVPDSAGEKLTNLISYSYEVDGQVYTSRAFAPNAPFTDKIIAEASAGDTIACKVQSDKPYRSIWIINHEVEGLSSESH